MEQPGHSHQDPPNSDNNEGIKSSENGPLKVEHFDGLTDEQKQDQAIHDALAKFNARFKGKDYDLVIQHLKALDQKLTFDDVPKLETYAAEVETKLANAEPEPDAEANPAKIADADAANSPESNSETLTPNFFLEKMGMLDLENQAPGFGDFLSSHPKIGTVLTKIQSFPPEHWEAAITKYKNGLVPIVQKAFEKFEDEQRKEFKVNEQEELASEHLQKAKEIVENQPDELTLPEIQKALSDIGGIDPSALPDELKSKLNGIRDKLSQVQSQLSTVPGMASNPEEAPVLQQLVQSTPVAWKANAPSQRYAGILGNMHWPAVALSHTDFPIEDAGFQSKRCEEFDSFFSAHHTGRISIKSNHNARNTGVIS